MKDDGIFIVILGGCILVLTMLGLVESVMYDHSAHLRRVTAKYNVQIAINEAQIQQSLCTLNPFITRQITIGDNDYVVTCNDGHAHWLWTNEPNTSTTTTTEVTVPA